MRLESVVPWGRSMDEYVRMFDLDGTALSSRIIGVGDGPASFNVEMHEAGRRVVSCDPIYVFSAAEIRSRVEATHERLIAAVREHPELFVWDVIESPEMLSRMRLAAMGRFLADYSAGLREGRYVAAGLPHLPFADHSFDLAFCSHLLFLYSDQLSREFHIDGMLEMLRIAREVRVFPLLALGSVPSPHLQPVIEEMRDRGFSAEVRRVPYEFQKGGNEMLVVTR